MRLRTQGFSLLEILLVLALLGILLGLFSANLSPSPQQQLNREAKRIQAVLQFAADEAVMQGLELALALPEQGYQILRFNPQELAWEALSDKAFLVHELPEGMRLDLSLQDQALSDNERQQLNRLKKQQSNGLPAPMVLLLSSGELSAFELRLSMAAINAESIIYSDGYSGVTLR
ncbi:type II secretion system minor pseudopilin GspH [Dasania marina]|uniref:type II secretion system minor pseudopilin GspH n=1 Tax=Dasania marina TaxID=471499 RepID=UPI00036F72D8|nr:type II secretion system minor pseudopilin GspH [Dasania marina]